jgi:HEAT repeat protein
MSQRRARKERVRELLLRRDLDGFRAWADGESNAFSALVSLLLSPEALLRWRAIEALGELSAGRAGAGELDAVRDLVRRQLWSMNDESGNQAWHAAEAIGEVLHRVPALAPTFAPNLFAFAATYPFEAGVCFAIGRLAASSPALIGAAEREALRAALGHPTDAVRGEAARAIGELRDRGSAEALRPLLGDGALVERYRFESGELEELPVGELARAALDRIGGA